MKLLTTLFFRFGYRPLMKLAHRYHWHYAPVMPRMVGERPDGTHHHWCQWCGLRGTTVNTAEYKRLITTAGWPLNTNP